MANAKSKARAPQRRGDPDGGITNAERGLPDAGAAKVGDRAIQRGVGDAGVPDAGSAPPVLAPTSLLLYHTASETLAESKNICAEPKFGLWRKARVFQSLDEAIQIASTTASSSNVTTLGILTHGDRGGAFGVGSGEVNPATFAQFKSQLAKLLGTVAPGGDVIIFGCNTGQQEDGSAMLKEVSKLIPGRRVIAFGVRTAVGTAATQKGKSGTCFDPDIFATPIRTLAELQVLRNERGKLFVERATAEAKKAKVAKDGKIIKWPDDETPSKYDKDLRDVIKKWGGKLEDSPPKKKRR